MKIKSLFKTTLALLLISLATNITVHALDIEYVGAEKNPTGQSVFLNGGFYYRGDGQRAADKFNSLPFVAGKELFLFLDISGGSFTEFDIFAKALKNRRTQAPLHTVVTVSSECSSACLTLYMVGQRRIALTGAKFGFHSTHLKSNTGKIPLPLHMELKYRSLGVSGNWILKNLSLFRSIEIQYLTPLELVDSNIVTEVWDNDAKIVWKQTL